MKIASETIQEGIDTESPNNTPDQEQLNRELQSVINRIQSVYRYPEKRAILQAYIDANYVRKENA